MKWLYLFAVVLVAATCASDDKSPIRNDDLLVEVDRIELEEVAEDPIVGVEFVGQRPEGGYLIADRHAGRVRLFDSSGRRDGVVGAPGEGPGELEEPAGAVEMPDGRIVVVQRSSPRLTIFLPDSTPTIRTIPGQYGFWAEQAGEGFVAGVATRDTRFALFDDEGMALSTFASRDPGIAETPFWIYFADEHATAIGDRVAVSTSLFPTIRLFDLAGDSVGVFGEAPPDWTPVSVPPVSDLSAPGSRDRIAQWSRTFTVVRQLAVIGDSLLVVEYGRHDPRDSNPNFVMSTTADIYSLAGEKVALGLKLPGPVVGGGRNLLVLVAEPPDPWTIVALAWSGDER
jgi:hypothetical protein